MSNFKDLNEFDRMLKEKNKTNRRNLRMRITDFNDDIAYFTYDKEKKRRYHNLKDLYQEHGKDEVYRVLGLYINEGKFGEQGSAVLDDIQVNLPNHLVESIKEIRSDESLVNDINDGKVGFQIYEYKPRNYNVIAYSIRWVEIKVDEVEHDLPF